MRAPRSPYANLRDLIKLAKAKPGKLDYASSGPGTPYHMAGELFKAMAGVDIVHVPYKGSSGARTDVIGGQVDMMFDAVTTMSRADQGRQGHGPGHDGQDALAILPDVPTMAEAGVPGYEATIWLGLMAPKGTPPRSSRGSTREMAKVTGNADVRKGWARSRARRR